MSQINCHFPIKLRIVGKPSDVQLEQLGHTLAQLVGAQLTRAERTLRAHGHGTPAQTTGEAREQFMPARLSAGYYSLPSYDQGGNAVDVPLTSDPEAEEMWESARAAWIEQVKLLTGEQRATADRIYLLLIHAAPAQFKNEDHADRFIAWCEKSGPDEDNSLAEFSKIVDASELETFLVTNGLAFPRYWAARIARECGTPVDPNALLLIWESKRTALSNHAVYLVDEIWARGLPLAKADAAVLRLNTLVQEALNSELAKAPTEDILVQHTQAMLRFERATAHYWLVQGYKQQTVGRIDRIRNGDLIIDKDEYAALRGAARFFQNKERLFEEAAASDDLGKTLRALLLWDPSKFNRLYFVGWQNEGVALLWGAIGKVDARIAATGKFACIWRALLWAETRGYFGAAGKEVYETIKDNWLKMIGTMVAIIVVQAIPGLDLAVDLVLLIKFGSDGIQALFDLASALKAAGGANSVVEMEHAAVKLASVLVGVAADIALWAATWGTVKVAKELVALRKVEKFVKEYGDNVETRDSLIRAKGNAEEAEKILKTKREHERQARELQEAERRRQLEVAERQRKRTEAEETARHKQAEEATARKQQVADKLAEAEAKGEGHERASAKSQAKRRGGAKGQQEQGDVSAKQKQQKEKASKSGQDKEPVGAGKGKQRPLATAGAQRDFVAEYDFAQESLRTARNEVQTLEQQLQALAQRKEPFAGKRELQEDLVERLEGAKLELSTRETAAAQAEQALRNSTLALHEKLGAAARNRKEYRDVVRLANGEDKVGGFKVDLKTDHIAPDHLVAIRRISTDPKFRGFEKLSWQEQLEIVNMPDNLIAMKGSFNSSKGARPWRDWTQARQYYTSTVVDKMIVREATVEQLIVERIAAKLRTAPRKGS